MEKNTETNVNKFKITKPEFELHVALDATQSKLDEAHTSERDSPSGANVVDSTPNANHYRNLRSLNGAFKSRPTLEELQNLDSKKKTSNSNENNVLKKERSLREENIVKFGWIKGVLIRCVLNIFGVMIFLRISWVVGQAGVGLASIVVVLASFVTFVTALSLSAICTNGEVKGGGAYYLISRSLGPEFGGAIGIVYAFANAVAAAMYVVGFAESFVQLLKDNSVTILDGGINDIRIVGMITNVMLLVIALIGMTWEAKVQIFLLIILVLALFNFIVGSFIPHESKEARGFVGYSFKTLKNNFLPDFRDGEDFAHVFGVFFPAVTGILAGANISGNLKNPQQAIPKGTLLSIFITSFVYLAFCWICGLTVVRDANGDYSPNSTHFNCVNTTCKYGLTNSYQVMEMVSEIPAIMRGNSPIIIAGIFSASLSSALASIVSAPKIFQAVASDKIFPKIDYFAVGYGKDNEPWRGYFLTFIIASLFIALGELNVIAPIISNFFLMSYALVNYSCFDASIAKTPGWRPAFKYYNKWVSLFGSLLCITVMFLIEWWAALLSFVVVAGFYVYVKQAKPNINWGSSTQAHIYRRSLEYSLKLINTEEHVKNFRPNFLVLTGVPNYRPALCDLISSVTKNTSLMACANIKLSSDLNDPDSVDNNPYKWMRKRRIKSFYTEINASSLRSGAVSLMQCVGVGKMRPNTLAMGFKNDWQQDTWQSVLDYYQIINDAFQMNYGVCILRLEPGLDLSNFLNEVYECSQECSLLNENENDNDNDNVSDSSQDEIKESLIETYSTQTDLKKNNIESIISQNMSNLDDNNNRLSSSPTKVEFELPKSPSSEHTLSSEYQMTSLNLLRKSFHYLNSNNASSGGNLLKSTQVIMLKNTKINQGMLQGVNLFHKKNRHGYVDVWWLFDDGGLTILIPYLLMQRKQWAKCKLRIFIQTKNEKVDITEEQRNMATLLSKFRIKFHDLIVFSTLNKKPDASNILIHQKLIENWRLKPNEKAEDFPWKITDDMYKANIDKTNSHLILRDLLMQYSQNSELVLITISVPSRLNTCAALFLSWLDLISHQMPPVLLIRGNQAPVLTYYS